MLTVLLGGARSGKSSLAERLAARTDGAVTYLATCPRIDGDVELDAANRSAPRRPAGALVDGRRRARPRGSDRRAGERDAHRRLPHHVGLQPDARRHDDDTVLHATDAAITAVERRAGQTDRHLQRGRSRHRPRRAIGPPVSRSARSCEPAMGRRRRSPVVRSSPAAPSRSIVPRSSCELVRRDDGGVATVRSRGGCGDGRGGQRRCSAQPVPSAGSTRSQPTSPA